MGCPCRCGKLLPIFCGWSNVVCCRCCCFSHSWRRWWWWCCSASVCLCVKYQQINCIFCLWKKNYNSIVVFIAPCNWTEHCVLKNKVNLMLISFSIFNHLRQSLLSLIPRRSTTFSKVRNLCASPFGKRMALHTLRIGLGRLHRQNSEWLKWKLTVVAQFIRTTKLLSIFSFVSACETILRSSITLTEKGSIHWF